MSDQPAPITDEELDVLREKESSWLNVTRNALIARLDAERNRADRLRDLLENVPFEAWRKSTETGDDTATNLVNAWWTARRDALENP